LQRAIRQRNGSMIALLAMMPMRRRAFAGLALGTSLIVGRDVLTVALPEELTKTGLPWEADVPEPAAGLLRRYLAETRPFLMMRGRQRHGMLWVGDDGRPMSDAHMGPKIATITERLTGKRIPPHFFRDAAATTLVRESPVAARLVRPVLAHVGFGTAERHYIHARSIEAGRDYARLLKNMREKR
jgi:integrase